NILFHECCTGITRNAIGDQPENIYEKIVDLITNYIEKPTAIVLHVIPSSEDFTNSESMKICKKYDPNGDRQLIAVSKIDKYDKGISDKLQGIGPGSMALKLGCIAVLNRTPEQIEEDVPFCKMRQLEQQFFQLNKTFQHVPLEYLGCEQLIKRLVSIQQARIRSTLPGILEKLKNQIKDKKSELKNMPQAITSEIECWTLYINLIKKYRDLIYARVHGVSDNDMQLKMEEPTRDSSDLDASPSITQTTTDSFDDRIAFQLHKQQKAFAKEINHSFSQFFTSKYRNYVLKLLEENAGVALPNFPSFNIIERLYHHEHRNFREPCEDLIESCATYLKQVLIKLLNQIFDKEATYKNHMIHKLTDIIYRALEESEEHCNHDISKMLNIEQRIFTLNHYYMDTVNKIKAEVQQYIANTKLPISMEYGITEFDYSGDVGSDEHNVLQMYYHCKRYANSQMNYRLGGSLDHHEDWFDSSISFFGYPNFWNHKKCFPGSPGVGDLSECFFDCPNLEGYTKHFFGYARFGDHFEHFFGRPNFEDHAKCFFDCPNFEGYTKHFFGYARFGDHFEHFFGRPNFEDHAKCFFDCPNLEGYTKHFFGCARFGDQTKRFFDYSGFVNHSTCLYLKYPPVYDCESYPR
ncbi:unnamed protein product, partial [Rotaria sp. Silwood2]